MTRPAAALPAVGAWHPPDLGNLAATTTADAAMHEDMRRVAWLEGHTSAMTQRDAQLSDALTALQAAQRAMQDTTERLRAQVATTVHVLAVAIAQHLLEREMSADPALMQRLVIRALGLAPMNGTVVVRLNPADLTALTALGTVAEFAGTTVDLRWTSDETILRGGCVVEGPAAIIDGRIDRALLDIYEQISHD
ncbi:MAG TPA: FliH/SctL family protein [Gemmatimonadales bacterium]|jgi:flagellar biosynthesis/type III secretory pathway protein FliH